MLHSDICETLYWFYFCYRDLKKKKKLFSSIRSGLRRRLFKSATLISTIKRTLFTTDQNSSLIQYCVNTIIPDHMNQKTNRLWTTYVTSVFIFGIALGVLVNYFYFTKCLHNCCMCAFPPFLCPWFGSVSLLKLYLGFLYACVLSTFYPPWFWFLYSLLMTYWDFYCSTIFARVIFWGGHLLEGVHLLISCFS